MGKAPAHGEEAIWSEPAERLRFEVLVADLAAKFVNVPSEAVDGQIVDAQRQLCACLGMDGSSVWQFCPDDRGSLLLTHVHLPPGAPPLPDDLRLTSHFPWSFSQLVLGKTLFTTDTSEVPAEAARDRETWRQYGIRSSLAFPLSVGGGPMFGVLAFDAVHRKMGWPDALVTRCRLIANVFASALARKRSEQALAESEKRYRSLADNLPGVVYEFFAKDDGRWGVHYVHPRLKELCGLDVDPIDTCFDRFAACVAPEDKEEWFASIRDAIRGVQSWECEFRFVKPNGEMVYLKGLSKLRPAHGERIAAGILRDISEQKKAERALGESQTTLSAIIDSTSDMIWSVDHESFGLLTFNRGLRDYFLRHRNIEIQPGMRPEDLFPAGEYVQRWHEYYRRALKEGPYTTEYLVYALSRTLQLSFSILRRQGVVFGVSVFGKDVTDQKKADDELHRTLDELNRLREQLQHENVYLREEVQALKGQMPIVGNSESLRKVLVQAKQVAATDSTVLILGETGTGKELLARYLHRIGKRSAKPFITTNIAAIPSTLLEGELFGREKGAYTGALTKQIGRFELADGGTLFLDEIGDMPLETQVKLLRVLQNGEFERLGSSRTLRVDVQVIAATNRQLLELVREGKFREDLYYRVNVFPITLPPLRERLEDIPLLISSFVQEFSERMGKRIEGIRRKDLEALQSHDWPGNVRELRNVVERSMILADGSELRLVLPQKDRAQNTVESRFLRDVEKSHIEKVLSVTSGRIRGPHGAAQILGLKPPTLYALMDRLGIERKGQSPARHNADGASKC